MAREEGRPARPDGPSPAPPRRYLLIAGQRHRSGLQKVAGPEAEDVGHWSLLERSVYRNLLLESRLYVLKRTNCTVITVQWNHGPGQARITIRFLSMATDLLGRRPLFGYGHDWVLLAVTSTANNTRSLVIGLCRSADRAERD